MRDKEKLFLKAKIKKIKQILKYEFLSAQKFFDRRLRFFERKYRKDLALNIEHVSTTDPRKFWEELKKNWAKEEVKYPYGKLYYRWRNYLYQIRCS